jgi:hypothetical protein
VFSFFAPALKAKLVACFFLLSLRDLCLILTLEHSSDASSASDASALVSRLVPDSALLAFCCSRCGAIGGEKRLFFRLFWLFLLLEAHLSFPCRLPIQSRWRTVPSPLPPILLLPVQRLPAAAPAADGSFSGGPGSRMEAENLANFRAVQEAIFHEAARQALARNASRRIVALTLENICNQ